MTYCSQLGKNMKFKNDNATLLTHIQNKFQENVDYEMHNTVLVIEYKFQYGTSHCLLVVHFLYSSSHLYLFSQAPSASFVSILCKLCLSPCAQSLPCEVQHPTIIQMYFENNLNFVSHATLIPYICLYARFLCAGQTGYPQSHL